jgi:hypothetical protein
MSSFPPPHITLSPKQAARVRDSQPLAVQYANPDLLNPDLPHPYSMVDSIIRQCIDDALVEITRKDLVERNKKGWDIAKPCLPAHVVGNLGMVTVRGWVCTLLCS